MVLEVGGRSEVFDASGVLFLFPIILLAMAKGHTDVKSCNLLTKEAEWSQSKRLLTERRVEGRAEG